MHHNSNRGFDISETSVQPGRQVRTLFLTQCLSRASKGQFFHLLEEIHKRQNRTRPKERSKGKRQEERERKREKNFKIKLWTLDSVIHDNTSSLYSTVNILNLFRCLFCLHNFVFSFINWNSNGPNYKRNTMALRVFHILH